MKKALGICPACNEAVQAEDDEPAVWTCPADLSPSNPYSEPAHDGVTEDMRESAGIFSNCGEDFGFPCYERLPLHAACYGKGSY